jgi:spermidine export protein MdtI
MIDHAFLLVFAAGLLDVGANIASKKSDGFHNKTWGALSLLLVFAAFGLLAQANKTLDLPVAYAVLGTTGIVGTALAGRFFWNQRLTIVGWCGIGLVIVAIVVLHVASQQPLERP